MSIIFNEIPTTIMVPGQVIEVDNTQAVRGLTGLQHRIVIIGQKLATGMGEKHRQYHFTDWKAAIPLFGESAMITQMIRKAREANPFQQITAIAVDDLAAGSAATGSIGFAAASVKAGLFSVLIAGKRVRIGVAAAATATAVAAALVAAINEETDLDVTAEVNGAVDTQVDLTARHKGELGNDITIIPNYYDGEVSPIGLTHTITAMSGGAGNPEIDDALATIGEDWFTEYALPYTDAANYLTIQTFLENNFTALVMKDSMAYGALHGTHAELISYAQGKNCHLITMSGLKNCPTPPWERAAIRAAVACYNLAIHPGRPLQELEMKGCLPPPSGDEFTKLERQLLLENGISTEKVSNGKVYFERAITMYGENSQGVKDTSYLNVNTLALIRFIRWSERVRIALRFPRSILRDDDPNDVTGNDTATPSKIRNELIALARELYEARIIEDLENFIEGLVVERDANDRDRVNCRVPWDVVNQFRIYASKLEFRV